MRVALLCNIYSIFVAYYFSPLRKVYRTKKGIGTHTCAFCDNDVLKQQAIKNKSGESIENRYYNWVVNYFPKFEGHTMLVPKKHITSLDEESAEELVARNQIATFAAKTLQKLYPGSGIEIFLQYGPGSAASIPHLHWHIVPALPNDTLRSFEKLGHFYTESHGKEKVILFPIKIEKAKKSLQEALLQTIGNDSLVT